MWMTEYGMRRAMRGVGVFLCLLWILFFSGMAYGGTFFLFVEETVDGEFLSDEVSPVLEGLLMGLFDRGHIVFDDNGLEPGFSWEREDFSLLLETGRKGGAEYFVAVKVGTESIHPDPSVGEATAMRYGSVIRYYCYDVGQDKLLAKGDLTDSNEGMERSVGRIDLGLQLGNQLAASVEEICLGAMELAAEEKKE